MSGGSIRGVVGQITWSYYVAATLNGFMVSRSPENIWSVRGTVVLSDAYKLAQRPLILVMPTEKGHWRWPIQTVDVVDGKLTATLGAPLP